MKDKNLINTFETIAKFDNFSKYNSILDKKFRDKSLKNFVAILKHYKTKDKGTFLEEFYKKYPYQFEEKGIIEDDDALFDHIYKSKIKSRNEKELKPINEKHAKTLDSNKKINENEIPDSLRYNPNYNSIFKRIPGFKMAYNKTDVNKNKKFNKNLILNSKIPEENKTAKNLKKEKDKNKSESQNNDLFKTHIKINTKSINNNKNKNNIILHLPPISFKNMNNNKKLLIEENNKSNYHKTIESKKNIKQGNNEKMSSIQHYNNNILINKAIFFKKMSSRNDKYILNSYSLNVPSFGKYSPKYSFIENNVKNIKFSPFGLNKNNKKFLLKKMMGSYNVPTEYQFIDNEKLTNDNILINKQLILNYNINPEK